MKTFRADLHIHSLLSPCGDLEMSPANIVSEASQMGIDIIGITDHNTTRHCNLIGRLAEEKGIFVMKGAEITTREEVHSLVFFENYDTLYLLQEFIDAYLPEIINIPEKFGHQVEVDENENIIYEEKRLLTNAISRSLGELEVFVHKHFGLFIPAHIDRKKNSIYSQLGFLPSNLNADALEISRITDPKQFAATHPEIAAFTLTRSSDAHYPGFIGTATTNFHILKPSFSEIKMALHKIDGRKVITE